MRIARPEDFARAFTASWSARDPEAMAALFAEDADFLTLTGAWAEGRQQIAEILAGEVAGAFARAKLVTGRNRLRMVGPNTGVILQRYVLSGLRNADGSDAGRIGAVLVATLARDEDGWRAVVAQFCAAE